MRASQPPARVSRAPPRVHRSAGEQPPLGEIPGSATRRTQKIRLESAALRTTLSAEAEGSAEDCLGAWEALAQSALANASAVKDLNKVTCLFFIKVGTAKWTDGN